MRFIVGFGVVGVAAVDMPLLQRGFAPPPVSSDYRQAWVFAYLALLAASSAGAVGAAELKVLCSGAMLQQLVPAFEKIVEP